MSKQKYSIQVIFDFEIEAENDQEAKGKSLSCEALVKQGIITEPTKVTIKKETP